MVGGWNAGLGVNPTYPCLQLGGPMTHWAKSSGFGVKPTPPTLHCVHGLKKGYSGWLVASMLLSLTQVGKRSVVSRLYPIIS